MYCLEIQGLFKTSSQIQGLNFNTAQTLEREGGMVVRPHKFLRGKQQITSAHDCHYPVIFFVHFLFLRQEVFPLLSGKTSEIS